MSHMGKDLKADPKPEAVLDLLVVGFETPSAEAKETLLCTFEEHGPGILEDEGLL